MTQSLCKYSEIVNTEESVRNITSEGRGTRNPVYGRDWASLTNSVSVFPSVPVGLYSNNQVSRWKWKAFSSAKRKDGLELFHWSREDKDEEKEDLFSNLNKEAKILKYTDSEYEVVCQETNSDSSWSREETNLLFQLCEKYNLRFTVIYDRWPDERRSLEELKNRYYSVARKLAETRKFEPSTRNSVIFKHVQALIANPFDVDYERQRKVQLDNAFQFSKKELDREENTVREARQIEANRKRRAKERQRIQKLLSRGGDIRHPASVHIVPSVEYPSGQKEHFSNRHRQQQIGNASASEKYDRKGNFPRRRYHSGAFERSSILYTPVSHSQRNIRRVEGMLEELGVGLRPMPTATIVEEFDSLRLDLLNYFEAEKVLIRKEWDLHNLKVRLSKLRGEEPPPVPTFLAESSRKQEDTGVNTSHRKRRKRL
ncbi:DNA methyltransferase 1-associated protein 1 [Galdieria sulphuraria]|uniref:DNA methyltransferase 1-associated protein 1 n=1 Tax=Galdieria sulphuraria TaxID=130081 RepID=M2W9Y7_GALSU|nr:DNA methyltransferase 1-associated protein 1 [Galdieria sulphuraria]EME32726.1 DNA methyltransferase 1-associated protein 1 [Galdieria sulphuraria]GJD07927.1 DNA methyltransferase 1-associated protein 1 [Galdieria sulphuraria]|eukprot:XP_005709246.1 DNA methyltransferase 1-associated protein 1 [Galdieria sulphuraria]